MAVFPHWTSPTRTSLHLTTSGCVFLLSFMVLLSDSFLSRFHRKYHREPAQEEKKNDACVLDGRAPRRMRAVDLIEFATAALYTSEAQPMRAHTFHRLLLLHPATTTTTATAGLVCRQQDRRIDASASSYWENIPARQTRWRHFFVNSLKPKFLTFFIDLFFTSAQNSDFIP